MKKAIAVTILLTSSLFIASCSEIAYNKNDDMDLMSRQSFIIYQMPERTVVQNKIDQDDKIFFTHADEAIQYAIDTLPEQGGDVTLLSGKYILKDQINLKSKVQLKGSGPATELWIDDEHKTGNAFSLSVLDRVSISNLSIKAAPDNPNAKTGIKAKHCGDCQFKDVFCLNLKEHGIHLGDRSFLCEIRGCKFANIGISAIYLEGLDRKGRGGDYVPNLITNCIIYAGGEGIRANDSLVINIIACEVYQTGGIAFHFANGSNSILVSGCRTYQIQNDAVVVEDSHEINLSSNIFCWQEGHGIVLKNVTWGTLTGNNVIDSGSVNLFDPDKERWAYLLKTPNDLDWDQYIKNGINLLNETKGITVAGNAVFNWGNVLPMDYGIYEDSTCSNNVVTGNNINYCRTAGISLHGTNSKQANNFSDIDVSYHGTKTDFLHRFDTRRIQRFIREQK